MARLPAGRGLRRRPRRADPPGRTLVTHAGRRAWTPCSASPGRRRERAAARITTDLAGRLPALHAVLRRHADHPAVRTARAVDRAGRASPVRHCTPSTCRPAGRRAPQPRSACIRTRLRTAVTA
ncbi:hypothetical protein HBB16_10945 [Pseudonocardia sp. MCCB 268]|nr:hypothetical protein [Pseudonocardia cytotoxica]